MHLRGCRYTETNNSLENGITQSEAGYSRGILLTHNRNGVRESDAIIGGSVAEWLERRI